MTPAAEIALLVLDVDGVLTDGRLWYGPEGESLKAFHVRDGHGIKALLAAGVGVAVISGRRSGAVATRMRELGVADVAEGVADKGRAIRLPVYVNTALNRVRRERQRLVQELGREPTEQELAEALEMDVERLHELEAAPGTPISLELPVGEDEEQEP